MVERGAMVEVPMEERGGGKFWYLCFPPSLPSNPLGWLSGLKPETARPFCRFCATWTENEDENVTLKLVVVTAMRMMLMTFNQTSSLSSSSSSCSVIGRFLALLRDPTTDLPFAFGSLDGLCRVGTTSGLI